MNPSSQYFWAQALQSALNGINSSNLIGVLSGVGYAVLLLSFLWGVYESFLQGGDVRGFAISLMKYGVTTLVIQHWSQVFQDAVNGFGDIAATIIQNSVNLDLTKSWTQQLQTYLSQQSSTGLSNGLQAIWNTDGAIETAVINLLLTLVSVAIWPLCVEVFALLYSLWGCVLYCIGPLVLALMPSMGFSRITKGYIQNVLIWNMWVILLAILWAMLWAMNLTSVDTVLNTDGLLGYLQGVNATLLVSISTLLLSICTLLIPFVAQYILHGEFGPVGRTAMMLFRTLATAAKGLAFAGAGAAAAGAGAGASGFGGAIGGGYGGLVPAGMSGGASGGSFSIDGAPLLGGGSGGSRFSLPPSETPPPDSGTRYFPRNGGGGGPLRLPPPASA